MRRRRSSLSCRNTTTSQCPTFKRCYGYHFNDTNGLSCFSAIRFIQVIKQRSHSAPPDYQEVRHKQIMNDGRKRRKRKDKKIKKKKVERKKDHRDLEKKKDHRDRGCGIPNRWLNYSISTGIRPIEGTRFIAFKTPLHPYFFASEDTQNYRFDVDTIVKHVGAQNKTLGLVIDLTDTNRYYDSSRWRKHQIEYSKLNCPGHQVNQNEHFFETFLQIVKNFFAENVDNENLIGVHCTHGLNRTGYLICRYLIQEKNWSAAQAIESFGAARGYPIERGPYIKSLYKIEKIYQS